MPKNKKWKIVIDVILNALAGIIPVAVLQLFVFPMTAQKLGGDAYGLMLYVVAMMMLVSSSLGSVLNNIRLLRQNDYAALGQQGDYNILLFWSAISNAAIIIVCTIIYCGFDLVQIFLTMAAATLVLGQAYILVCFRLDLNYGHLLINNLLLVLGYGIGYLIFHITGFWQSIYIAGYGLSVIHMMSYSNFLREPFRKTPLFRGTFKMELSYIFATVCAGALAYADKIILYPLLGGTMVSVYYSATIMGKICAMAISPISSVMLSYLAKMKTFQIKWFVALMAGGGILAIFGYFICMIISGPLLQWLYPVWAEQSMTIIGITTATAMLSMVCGVLNPIILKFCHINWQVRINIISVTVYVGLGYFLIGVAGLRGFAFGVLASYCAKAILLVCAFFLSFLKKRNIDMGMTV